MSYFSAGEDKLEKFRVTFDFKHTPRPIGEIPGDAFTFSHATSGGTYYEADEWSGRVRPTDKFFENAIRVPWMDSHFAAEFAQTLANLGATVQVVTTPQERDLTVLAGIWHLTDGTPFMVFGEVWRDQSSQKEFIFWNFDALVRTRPWSRVVRVNPALQLFLPKIFNGCVYVSEAPSPLEHESKVGRRELFEIQTPPPIAFHAEENHFHAALVGEGEDSHVDFFWTAETIRYGYIFDEVEDLESLETALAIAATALPKVAEVLVDGFSNNPGTGKNSFQGICGADAAIFTKGEIKHYEMGIFIPGPIHLACEMRTISIYALAQELLGIAQMKRDKDALFAGLSGIEEVISHGAGGSFVHAVNVYVYMMLNFASKLIGQSAEDEKAFKIYGSTLLKYISAMPVDLQDANALSNLALLEISREQYSAAIEAVSQGIEKLKEDRMHFPQSMMGNSNSAENPWIKLELFATKAELIYRSGKKDEAKALASLVVEEAAELEYEGPEIAKMKWVLSN